MFTVLRLIRQLTNVLVTPRIRSERGATAVEYGLLVALIAVAVVGAVTFLSDNID